MQLFTEKDHFSNVTLTIYKTKMTESGKSTGANRRLAKKRVQWLNEALCFVSSFVVADSFRLRNRQLLVAVKRYKQA